MSDTLKWWAVSAGTPDHTQGETGGSIRASSEERARELYLLNRPATWVIFDIQPGEAPTMIDPLAIAAATAAAAEARIAAERASIEDAT